MELPPRDVGAGLARTVCSLCLVALVLAPGAGGSVAAECLLQNASFEAGCDKKGVPLEWRSPNSAKLALVGSAFDGQRALEVEDGGRVSQEVPAREGEGYTFTAQAMTHIAWSEEKKRFWSKTYLKLTFVPSGTWGIQEMVSPFGVTNRYVDHAFHMTAPLGTTAVRAEIFVSPHWTATIDAVRLSTRQDSCANLELKDLHLDTVLAHQGKPAGRIVLPDSGVYDEHGKRIQDCLKELTGVEFPVVRDTDLRLTRDQRLDENLVLLGNRNTNKAISDLYDLYYCLLDLRYPGPGGSVVRTLHSPFGDGHNVVLIGASDAEGMAGAQDVFLKELRSARNVGGRLTLGRLAAIQLGRDIEIPPVIRRVRSWDACRAGHGFGWNVLTRAMALYYMTGDEKYAAEFLRLAFPKDRATVEELFTFGQDFRGDRTEPLVDVYHYRADLPVVYWDLIEESPVFSDEDRVRVTRAFMKQARTYRKDQTHGCGIDNLVAPQTTLEGRHHQWGAMTFFALGRYLAKDYPDYEWKRIKRGAEYFFSPVYLRPPSGRFFNKDEHGLPNRFGSRLAAMFRFTLISGNRTPLTNGALAEQMRCLEILNDGTFRAWVLRETPISLLNQAACLFEDGRFGGMRENTGDDTAGFRLGQSYWPDPELSARRSVFGANRWERFLLSNDELDYWEIVRRAPIPASTREKAFRYASFRYGEGGPRDYLLVCGIREKGNCMCLLDAMVNGHKFFHGLGTRVNVSFDGLTAPEQTMYARFERAKVLGDSSLFEVGVPNYDFTDWTRTLWLFRGTRLFVIDKLAGKTDADRCAIDIDFELGADIAAQDLRPGAVTLRNTSPDRIPTLFRFDSLTATPVSNLPEACVRKVLAYDYTLLLSRQVGDWIEFPFEVAESVQGELVALMESKESRGVVEFLLDGKPQGDRFTHFLEGKRTTTVTAPLGRIALQAGKHVLRIRNIELSPDGSSGFIAFRSLRVIGEAKPDLYCLSFADKVLPEQRKARSGAGMASFGDVVRMSWAGRLKKGQTRTFFTVLSRAAGQAESGPAGCFRIAHNAAVLRAPEPGLIVVGTHGDVGAGLAMLTTDHLSGFDMEQGAGFLSSDKPVHVDWDFDSGRLLIQAAEKCTVTLSLSGNAATLDGPPGSMLRPGEDHVTLSAAPGEHVIRGAEPAVQVLNASRQQVESLLATAGEAWTAAPVLEQRPPSDINAPALTPDWRASAGDFPYDLTTFSVGDNAYAAVARDKGVAVLNDKGDIVSTCEAGSFVKTVHYWPEAGLLVAGCYGDKVVAFDLQGQTRWTYISRMNPEMLETGQNGWFDRRNNPWNRVVHALTSGVFLDGRAQLFAGSASTVEMLDENGELLHAVNAGYGLVTGIALVDAGQGG